MNGYGQYLVETFCHKQKLYKTPECVFPLYLYTFFSELSFTKSISSFKWKETGLDGFS